MNTKRKTLKMPVRYLMNLVLVGLLFVGLSYVTGNMLSTYQNKVLLTVGINIILAVSLNVATGYLGQLPLGHAGFMAVGAYACALFTKSSNLPKGVSFAIGLVLAWVIAGLFGVLIGIPALRLTGDYLAILTLGFGEIIRITLNNIDDVLGFKLFYGSKGLKNIPKYSNFTNVFLCVVITCFLIHAMMKSRHGRAVLAIRDNEIAAESCGIQTTYYKVMAFAFSERGPRVPSIFTGWPRTSSSAPCSLAKSVTCSTTTSCRRLLITVVNPASRPVGSEMAMPVWASP